MIRRRVGDEWWLIRQDDHARLSGEFAAKLGNDRFEPLGPRAASGVALHDCGWPGHDDLAPTLSAAGEPTDVFETPKEIALPIWTASADRAAAVDPYAGLLVSLHALALSAIVANHHAQDDLRWRFDLNKFQHRQIELQEKLRRQLGLRVDEPLFQGLNDKSADPRERRLIFDFRWLQALDRLSLDACCTDAPFDKLEPVHARVGDRTTAVRVTRNDARGELRLSPWPFREPRLTFAVPYRPVPARAFASEAEFQDLVRGVAQRQLDVHLVAAASLR